MISKLDFQQWKTDPITEAFMEACQDRIEDTKEILVISAGLDAVNDNFYRGFVRAYQEMLEFRVDEEDGK
jgi:hypothetical protein